MRGGKRRTSTPPPLYTEPLPISQPAARAVTALAAATETKLTEAEASAARNVDTGVAVAGTAKTVRLTAATTTVDATIAATTTKADITTCAVATVARAVAKAKAAVNATHTSKAANGMTTKSAKPTYPAHTDDPNQDEIDWELSENGLPEGSTLSGSKALLEDYPADEANSKKTKKTTPARKRKATPIPRNE